MTRWVITEERRSTVVKEVEADSEAEAEALASEMDGTETDNWLYNSTINRLD